MNNFIIKNWTASELNTLVKNLGEKLAKIIQRGEIENHDDMISKILENSSQTLKVWKSINIGTGLKNANGFRQIITNIGGKLCCFAEDAMNSQEFISSISLFPAQLNLCVMTTREIIGRSGSTKEIYQGIKRLGGELLPAEAGPQLRIQYLDQPKDECLLIAMQPIELFPGGLAIFDVGCNEDDGLWLYAGYSIYGLIWDADRQWVFSIPHSH